MSSTWKPREDNGSSHSQIGVSRPLLCYIVSPLFRNCVNTAAGVAAHGPTEEVRQYNGHGPLSRLARDMTSVLGHKNRYPLTHRLIEQHCPLIWVYGSLPRLFVYPTFFPIGFNMEGRFFAILGGASGIGLSMALLMASLGTDESITDVRRQEELEKTLTSIR